MTFGIGYGYYMGYCYVLFDGFIDRKPVGLFLDEYINRNYYFIFYFGLFWLPIFF